MSSKWQIRRYKDGDEAKINELFRVVFNVDRSLDEWKWKFREGPLGHLSSIHLAYDGERIVGQYAVVAAKFKCGDREVVAVQPVDNMIDPEYRQGHRRHAVQ